MMNLDYENNLRVEGYKMICGIDEAGRGPLAGPVYAAAVIFPENIIIDGVNDSKKLSPAKREKLFDIIEEKALSFGIGSASEKEIDNLNILQATFLAMKRAVKSMNVRPDYVIVDGSIYPDIGCIGKAEIKGDGRIFSVAAASILAKVSRDRVMLEYAKKYPQYGFEKHKGYGTKEHYAALETYGLCDIHRKSFIHI
jgi:ribonuclease HII